MIVVPIRVKIGLRPNGHADHPAWQQLPLVAAGLPSSPSLEQIDAEVRKHTLGSWHYDKTSGHAEHTIESPLGQQWGMLLVSRAFATEAMTAFPLLVTQMTQNECRDFWNTKAMIRVLDEEEDTAILNGLQARRALMVTLGASATSLAALDTRIVKALDPDDPEPGVRRNAMRRFATAQPRLNLMFHPTVLP